MSDISDLINSDILPHWPFFAAMCFFMITGRVMTQNVFTKTAHLENKPVWFWWWGRKTLPLHPILLGILLGIIWRKPEPDIVRLIPRMGYFSLAGGLSTWCYEFIKSLAKKRGIDLDLPGVDSVPPSAPPPTMTPSTPSKQPPPLPGVKS